MKILFDQGVPKPLQACLANHDVRRAFELGWAEKKNGELLSLAEAAGFNLLVTTDQNLLHQQNIRGRKIGVFILGRGNWPEIEPHAKRIASEINAIENPEIHFFAIS
ncbi:MAG: DUF5615 family PIN-like protein [Verrucomicrobiota bacterium]